MAINWTLKRWNPRTDPGIQMEKQGWQQLGDKVQNEWDKYTGAYQTEETNEGNLELAKYQYEMDRKMWKEQMKYNSPAEQMKRYEEAGLNPNLMYSQGNPGNVASYPQFQPTKKDYSQLQPLKVLDVIGMYQDFRMKDAQIDNVQAQNAVILQETENKALVNNLLRETSPYKIKQEAVKGEYADLLTGTEYQNKLAMLGINRNKTILQDKDLKLKDYDLQIKEQLLQQGSNRITDQMLDIEFKKYRNKLAQLGIGPNDKLAFRFLVQYLAKKGQTLKEFFGEMLPTDSNDEVWNKYHQ